VLFLITTITNTIWDHITLPLYHSREASCKVIQSDMNSSRNKWIL